MRRLLFRALSDLTGVVALIESPPPCPSTNLATDVLLAAGGPRRRFLRGVSIPDCMADEGRKSVKCDSSDRVKEGRLFLR